MHTHVPVEKIKVLAALIDSQIESAIYNVEQSSTRDGYIVGLESTRCLLDEVIKSKEDYDKDEFIEH